MGGRSARGPVAVTLPAEVTGHCAADVCDVLYRFAEGVDRRDWTLYRSVFTDEIDLDYSAYRPGSVGRISADDWVARAARRFAGIDATQHVMSNPQVLIDGGSARCTMYVIAHHHHGGGSYVLGGRYRDRLVRAAGEWRIESLTLEVWWTQGDPSLVGLPAGAA